MSKCQHLIDISPYDPLCDHPCRLYGGGAVEAECETCQYRIEAENAKLLKELEAEHALAETLGHCHEMMQAENDKLRELVRGLHMAYVGALNECESMDAGLIWDHCEMVDAELAKSHARFEADRHRFDAAMSELGIEEGA